jgi:hypothetical protein
VEHPSTNSASKAAFWTEFVARHVAFPAGPKLRAAFQAGRITRLCDCGCNSFDIEVPEGAGIPALAKPGGYGSVFEMSFNVNELGHEERRSLEFVVFADARGQFAGMNVDYCANSFPVPDNVEVQEPPFHVRCSDALAA